MDVKEARLLSKEGIDSNEEMSKINEIIINGIKESCKKGSHYASLDFNVEGKYPRERQLSYRNYMQILLDLKDYYDLQGFHVNLSEDKEDEYFESNFLDCDIYFSLDWSEFAEEYKSEKIINKIIKQGNK